MAYVKTWISFSDICVCGVSQTSEALRRCSLVFRCLFLLHSHVPCFTLSSDVVLLRVPVP